VVLDVDKARLLEILPPKHRGMSVAIVGCKGFDHELGEAGQRPPLWQGTVVAVDLAVDILEL
jgi:hypothetical protein